MSGDLIVALRSDIASLRQERDKWKASALNATARADAHAARVMVLEKALQRIDGINDNPSCFNSDIQTVLDGISVIEQSSASALSEAGDPR